MKAIAQAAIDAMTSGEAIESVALAIGCTPPVYVWGGYGTLTLTQGGVSTTFQGIGDRGMVEATGASIGDAEQNLTLQLSGVEPEVIAIFDATEVRRAPCKLWRLVFDSPGLTLLDAQVFTSGRLDQLQVVETVGGTSTITASIETAARGLGRSGQRMRTDADQRLIDANDGAFRIVSYAGNKTLYWGGQKPTSVATLGWTPLAGAGSYRGQNL